MLPLETDFLRSLKKYIENPIWSKVSNAKRINDSTDFESGLFIEHIEIDIFEFINRFSYAMNIQVPIYYLANAILNYVYMNLTWNLRSF